MHVETLRTWTKWSTYNRAWFSGPDKQEILTRTKLLHRNSKAEQRFLMLCARFLAHGTTTFKCIASPEDHSVYL
jgi:hypothetical protein